MYILGKKYKMKNQQLSAAALIIALAFACLAQAESSDLKTEFVRLQSQFLTAFENGDGATLDRMEVPNLVLVNGDGMGEIWQKQGPRGKLKPGPIGIRRILTDVTVRQFGDTAILTGIQTTKAPGSPDDNSSTTVVWVRQAGKWLVASMQWSDVAPAKK
jgi:ketosteroid isomerase-like protein